MSSGNLRAQHPELFRWNDGLDPARYLIAHFVVSSMQDGQATALAMAMEQSAATTQINGYVEPGMLTDWTARVRRVESMGRAPASDLSAYQLATEVYGQGDHAEGQWSIEIAFPLCLLQGKPAQIWNIIVGELPRLGFLTRFRLEGCELPAGFGPGPTFGVDGLRERFGVAKGPLLTRSMRPAVGLGDDTMARLNTSVLVGGFHLVKDDELLALPDAATFRRHASRMIAARDAARDRTGEAKGYIANLICEPDELAERWDIAVELGVDGVLVAPFIQGLGVLSTLARRRQLPLLSHNTFGDFFGRNPGWGISQAVLASWQESLGADWFVTSGPFCVDGSTGTSDAEIHHAPGTGKSVMPIIQGGKHPEGLPDYRHAVGSDDYMLIVASWVDSHPDGLEAAARQFREAIDSQPPLSGQPR
jgi:2,3-diketo-5-methylthiopentyl-1-phosphate enolase